MWESFMSIGGGERPRRSRTGRWEDTIVKFAAEQGARNWRDWAKDKEDWKDSTTEFANKISKSKPQET